MLGWVAVFYFGPLLQHAGAAVMTWVVIGGALYSLGAIVYGTKRPNPHRAGSASTRSSTR